VLHKSQLDDRQQLTSQCAQVDDMYESLAAHEQKVPTKDQVKHEDLTNELANFQNQLVLVSAAPTECRLF
jgi:dynein heavy chain